MKLSSITLIVVLVLIVLFDGCGVSSYNGMNKSRVAVNKAWGNVQSAYQRRADLIPNIVSTVSAAADFEKSTLTEVIQARASATQIKVDADDLTPEKMQQFQASQGQLSQALGRLMVVSEQYPQLRTTENFGALQKELEGTENRIKFARDEFNTATEEFNVKVTSFPGSIIAGFAGFKEKPMFAADQGSEKAPDVNAGFNKNK
ncbi:MAG: LemA family protein [Flavipsychrobacter sp.]|nr:LemA family protein [Flavipsychrobacter sp.]